MLPRVLEPEVMESPEEAAEYDQMDHAAVNRLFVADLLAAAGGERGLASEVLTTAGMSAKTTWILDLGTGTAQIPIELCRQYAGLRVRAVDAAANMLTLARQNVERAGLGDRIALERVDAKQLPYADQSCAAIVSNSIIHHIPRPLEVLAEVGRVAAPVGLIFFRDLLRPADDATVRHLVETYAGDATARQRELFDASLRAALTVDEMRALVGKLGFDGTSVAQTSDRHWTWSSRRGV